MGMLGSYLKIAFKVFLRRRFFTAVSLFGISFTLVVLTVAVAVLDHTLAANAPESRQGRTLGIYFARMSGPHMRWQSEPGYLLLDRYGRGLPGVERMSIYSTNQDVPSYLNGTRIQSSLKRTDGEYWKILDFAFLEGGPYTGDDVDNARFVAVITATTRRRFFGETAAVGQTLEADGQRFRVVGVVPDLPLLRDVPYADIWVPLTTAKSDTYRRELMGNFLAILLARSPADFPAIREEFRSRLRGVEMPSREFERVVAAPETRLEHVVGKLFAGSPLSFVATDGEGNSHLGRFWATAIAAVLLFMLLPTVNLVNLNVSRIMERASEIGVRKAFGATARTLVGQFVVENVALTLVGGALGFVLAYAVLAGLTASGLVPYARFEMNVRVFLWGAALAVAFGVFSGVYPAWRMSRLHPVEALGGGR
jgi:putative ABC transport system permease protein